MTTVRPESRLQQSLDDVTRVLDRHRVLETLTHRQEGPKRDLLESLQHRQNRRILSKELLVSLLNGSLWGVVVGIVAVALYANFALGAVMTGAVVLNLVVAAVAGVAIPFGLHSTGRDPAYGSSVLLTFITDAMGFFLFLGLASAFL
jgi:magnesium transporter